MDPALLGVSCRSSRACVAVGTWGDGEFPLIERWTGNRWHATVPTLYDAGGLGGVDCTSASNCLAIGGGAGGSSIFTIVQHWNGRDWADLPQASWHTGQLYGVSCSSAAFCVAVGDVIEQWNGLTWSLRDLHRGVLNNVSCVKATCMAVGAVRHRRIVPLSMLLH